MKRTGKVGIIIGGNATEIEYAIKSASDVSSVIRKLKLKDVILYFDKDILKNLSKENIDLAIILDATFIGTEKERRKIGRSLRRILDDFKIPHTGSSHDVAELTKNKIESKEVFRKVGLITPPYFEILKENDTSLKVETIISSLKFPLIVKPRDEGSSVGIEVVRNPKSLGKTVNKVIRKFGNVLVEEYINGTEVTVGVIEINSKPHPLPVIEIEHKADFYTRDAKLIDFKSISLEGNSSLFYIPARLPKNIYEEVQMQAAKVYQAIGCNGCARVDIIIKDKMIFILEINSLPVLSKIDFIAWAAKHEGISYTQLIEMLLKSVPAI